MPVKISQVDEYNQVDYDLIVKENLQSSTEFVPIAHLLNNADADYKENGMVVKLAAMDKEKLVGFCWGRSISKCRFMMFMSAVVPKYRNQGIYSKMLDMMLEMTREYDQVDSVHHLHNNSIISFKLRKHFYIVGTDFHEMIGPRIRLRYYNNEKIKRIMEFRVGLRTRQELLE